MTTLQHCLRQIAATENYYRFVDLTEEQEYELEDLLASVADDEASLEAQLRWLAVSAPACGAIVGTLCVWKADRDAPPRRWAIRLAA